MKAWFARNWRAVLFLIAITLIGLGMLTYPGPK